MELNGPNIIEVELNGSNKTEVDQYRPNKTEMNYMDRIEPQNGPKFHSYVTQKEYNNNKCYTSVFNYYIQIWMNGAIGLQILIH